MLSDVRFGFRRGGGGGLRRASEQISEQKVILSLNFFHHILQAQE